MTSHAVYSWHHSQNIWHCIHCISVTTTTLFMISGQLPVWHHTHFIYDIYAPYIMSPPLFMTYHHCSHHIASTVFMTSHKLYTTSHTWQHKLYICHHTHYIWHYIHCIQQHIHYICSITATVSVSHTHSFHDMTPFVCMTLQPLYV